MRAAACIGSLAPTAPASAFGLDFGRRTPEADAGASATTSAFLTGSQPRTRTAGTCSAADTAARSDSRLRSGTRRSGESGPGTGAVAASVGRQKSTLPLRMPNRKPTSAASRWQNVRSSTFAWPTCVCTVLVRSIVPGARFAPCRTFRTI